MKLIKPVLDYLGLGPDTDDDAGPPESRRKRFVSRLLDYLLPLALLAAGLVIGWHSRSDDSPAFAERPTRYLDEVLRFVGTVGVECSEPPEVSERPSGEWAICRGTKRFDLHVSPSIAEAYESFDSATLLGCYTVGDLPHQQWYLAHADNWNLLTHMRDVADDLARLPGVSITVGLCDVPTGSIPV